MSVLFILIAVSLVFASGFLVAFIWAMKDRQFEDDHTPAVRMLFDALPVKGEHGKSKIENGGQLSKVESSSRIADPLPVSKQ
jgi:cbb3-type cytochrome oxidase maturation protein